jgi:hypothetical protein
MDEATAIALYPLVQQTEGFAEMGRTQLPSSWFADQKFATAPANSALSV